MKFKINFLLAVSISMLLSCTSPKDSQNPQNVYLFSYFKGNGEDGLHLAYSRDGLKWTVLKSDSSFLTPQVGRKKLMRDPCIIIGQDNLFHLVWTIGWQEKGIGHACSNDLIHWSEQKYIPVMEHEPKAQNCWAPEIFYDDVRKQYLIFWATTIPGKFPKSDNQDGHNNHRMYFTTTKDFNTFSETKIFYDHGFNVIDATIVKDGNRFAMFLKDETNKPFTPPKNIRIAYSDNAEGPYSSPSEPISGDYWAEGPTVIKIKEKWHVYFDKYRLGSYGLIVSSDLENWTDVSDQLKFPKGLRHGTVFQVQESILKKLLYE